MMHDGWCELVDFDGIKRQHYSSKELCLARDHHVG